MRIFCLTPSNDLHFAFARATIRDCRNRLADMRRFESGTYTGIVVFVGPLHLTIRA